MQSRSLNQPVAVAVKKWPCTQNAFYLNLANS